MWQRLVAQKDVWVASLAASHRMENGPNAENRKILAEKIEMAHGLKWGKHWEKWKNYSKSHFLPFLGHAFTIFYFSVIFSNLQLSARLPFNARLHGSQCLAGGPFCPVPRLKL